MIPNEYIIPITILSFFIGLILFLKLLKGGKNKMARTAYKKYDDEDLEEIGDEEEENTDEEVEEEEDGLPPLKKKKFNLKKPKTSESQPKFYPRVVSQEEMQNEIYMNGQKSIALGNELLGKVDRLLESIE